MGTYSTKLSVIIKRKRGLSHKTSSCAEDGSRVPKALVVASIASFIYQFNMPNIKALQKVGFEVEVACNFKRGNPPIQTGEVKFKEAFARSEVKFHQIDFERNSFNVKKLIRSYRQLCEVLDKENYTLIHCHTPTGGIVARLAAKKYRIKTLYTAHGFHFFKGASLFNWATFYPIERMAAKITDTLITINKQDFALAKRWMKSKNIEYIPSVGIDLDKFINLGKRSEVKAQLGYAEERMLLLSVGELSERKNHKIIIKALTRLKDLDVVYIICGYGNKKEYLEKLAKKLRIDNMVYFLGYRENILNLYNAADIFVFPSKREGLGMAALEAMACGLPLVTSDRNGILDYSVHGETGFIASPNDAKAFSAHIRKLAEDAELRLKIGKHNQEAVKKFNVNIVMKKTEEIYSKYI